jgi:tripartite ATP-independent transporter DctP family solute receptor
MKMAQIGLRGWIVGAVAVLAVGAVQAKSITLGTTLGTRDVSTQAMAHWAKLLKERSGGRLDMKVIAGGTLGGDREHIQQLSSGEIDINLSSAVVLQHATPKYQCLEAEYVYENEDHGLKVWRGAIGKEVSEAMKKGYGMEIVGVGRRGARHITANKAILKPSDLAGVKMRVTNNLRAAVFQSYGALPAPLSLSELYGALRQGVFDAQENPLSTIFSNRFHEVQSHVSLTQHVWSYNIVLANSEFLSSLGKDRKVFEDTLTESIDWLSQAVDRENERVEAEIKKNPNVVFDRPDVAAFRSQARPVLSAYAEKNCRPGLLADIDKAAGGKAP